LNLQETGRRQRTGLIWLRKGTGSGILWMWYWTCGSIKCGEFLH